MIDFDRAEKAAEFIRDHAEQYGHLVGHCKGLEHQRKAVKGIAFLDASGTMAEKEATAYASPEFKSICEDIENAWADKTTLEIRLKAAEFTIDLYRSWNASNRRIDRSHT